jgi:hypothetical protein
MDIAFLFYSQDKLNAFRDAKEVCPAAFAATLYHCLGVSSHAQVPDRLGRPVHVMEKEPIAALIQ